MGGIEWGPWAYSMANNLICTHEVLKYQVILQEKGNTNGLANRVMLHLLGYSFNLYAGMLYTLSITPVAHDAYG